MERTTIYDVAARARVSTATVSRVLNGATNVADKTRRRVEAAIEELRFQPDRTARALAHAGMLTLAVALPSFTSQFYNELLKGIKDAMRERDGDLDLLLCSLGSTDPYQRLHRFLRRGKVDALLLASLPVDETLQTELTRMEAPVVLVGTHADAFDSYYWDEAEAARRTVAHLTQQGHRRIAMITGHVGSFNINDRIEGYKRALADARLPIEPTLIQQGRTMKHAGYSEEAGFEAMQLLLNRSEPPTAVFASSDVLGIGALKAIRDAGLTAPQDVSVAAYDDLKVSHYLDLTSLDPDIHGTGRRATERLLDRLRDRNAPPENVVLPTRLNVRRSSDSTLGA